jgi:hypothetical protein
VIVEVCSIVTVGVESSREDTGRDSKIGSNPALVNTAK